MKRVIGVDYGSKRVGLAISDGIGLTATPLEVVVRRNAVARIAELMSELDVDTVVVGLPTGLSGAEGDAASEARGLGAEIVETTGARVEYFDERFTSRMAGEALLEAGMKRRERRGTVDKVAAAIILQGYLDSRARGNS